MTKAEAERLCERLSSEHPDRRTHSWFPRRGDGGDWSVVKVPRLAGEGGPFSEGVEARPKPPQAEDPRPGPWKDAPRVFSG